MRKALLFIMVFSFIFAIVGCGNKRENKFEKNSPYNFMSYSGDEIKDIEQVDLNSSLMIVVYHISLHICQIIMK